MGGCKRSHPRELVALPGPHSPEEPLLDSLACLWGFFLFVFFPPTFMFTDSKDSKEVYFWLRPRC